MTNLISSIISSDQLITWLAIAFLILFFIYKEAPDFIKRISDHEIKAKSMEQTDKDTIERLEKIEKRIEVIDKKLNNDWDRLNTVEKATVDSLRERKILMHAMLSVIDGLQQLGANGKTHDAEREINEYLNEQAHK